MPSSVSKQKAATRAVNKQKAEQERIDTASRVLGICAYILEEKASRQKRQALFGPDEIDNEKMARVIGKLLGLSDEMASIALEEMVTGRPVQKMWTYSSPPPRLDDSVMSDDRAA